MIRLAPALKALCIAAGVANIVLSLYLTPDNRLASAVMITLGLTLFLVSYIIHVLEGLRP